MKRWPKKFCASFDVFWGFQWTIFSPAQHSDILCSGTSQAVYEEWESYSCFIQITLIMVVANIALGLHPSISFFQPLVCFLDRHLLPMQLPASSQVVFYDKEWSILRFYFALETRCYSYAWVIPLVELWHLQEAVRLSTFMHWYQVLSMAKHAVVVFYTCHCVVFLHVSLCGFNSMGILGVNGEGRDRRCLRGR